MCKLILAVLLQTEKWEVSLCVELVCWAAFSIRSLPYLPTIWSWPCCSACRCCICHKNTDAFKSSQEYRFMPHMLLISKWRLLITPGVCLALSPHQWEHQRGDDWPLTVSSENTFITELILTLSTQRKKEGIDRLDYVFFQTLQCWSLCQ